jgi:hypothetical protein
MALMATKATGKPASAQPAEAQSDTSVTTAADPAPPPGPAGTLHAVPVGFLRLVAPPGAEGALVGYGQHGFECFRERSGDRSSRWLVDVPAEAARSLCWNAGFKLYEAP